MAFLTTPDSFRLAESGRLSSSSKLFLHQHDVGFCEFVLNVENGFAVARHGQSPTGLFLEGPDRNGLAARKIEKLHRHVRCSLAGKLLVLLDSRSVVHVVVKGPQAFELVSIPSVPS
jgi:hypothetical protein